MAVATASSRQLAALKLLRRRLVQAVPLILGVVVINFCLIQMAPGLFHEHESHRSFHLRKPQRSETPARAFRGKDRTHPARLF